MCPVQTVTHVSGRSLRGFVLSTFHSFCGVVVAQTLARISGDALRWRTASKRALPSGTARLRVAGRGQRDCRGGDRPAAEGLADGDVRKWDGTIPRMVKTNPQTGGSLLIYD